MDNDTYDDRFIRINNRLESYEQTLKSLQSLIHHAIGPCTICNGSGMVYDQDEDAGRDLTRPCDDCKGSGKMPLDIVSMMAQFKLQARKDIQNETDIPF